MRHFAIPGFAATLLKFRMVIDMPGLCHLITENIKESLPKKLSLLHVVPKWQRKDRSGGTLLPSPPIVGLPYKS